MGPVAQQVFQCISDFSHFPVKQMIRPVDDHELFGIGGLGVESSDFLQRTDFVSLAVNKELRLRAGADRLEIVSTDYRPVAELVFTKVKGNQKENQTVDIEAFIAVKGFKALGNQLTADKLKQVNLLEPLPYEAPEEVVPEEMEVSGDTEVSGEADDTDIQIDDEGQITLF